MQITPAQIRAARAMLNLDQADLALLARKPSAMITAVEKLDGHQPVDPVDSVDPVDLQDIRHALELEGIEFIPHGLRHVQALTPTQQALYEELRAISRRSAAKRAGQDRLTDDDLYDEDGLPA